MPQTISAELVHLFLYCQHLNTSICVFLFWFKVSLLVHFQEIYALIVSNTNFHQFGHTFYFAFKWPRKETERKQHYWARKQNDIHSNKKPRVFEDEPVSANETFFGALSQGPCADWLVCFAYCIFWHLIGSDQLPYFS